MSELIWDVDQAISNSLMALSQIEANTWVIPQSGGKDSRTVGQLILSLIADGRLQCPERLIFYLADTLMEFELFDQQAKAGLWELESKTKELGIETYAFITYPIPQDDFWVRILGFGFTPPTAKMRTCTDKLKVVPPRKVLKRFGWGKAPLFLGVRRGESNRRDEILPCTLGGECGPDYLYLKLKNHASSAQRAMAPIVNWSQCAVWDFLNIVAPHYGFDNSALTSAYGDGSLRYGCWSCPLIHCDRTAEYLSQDDPKIKELMGFADTVLRQGGAAWFPENRELIRINGNLQDGRLSLEFCQRLYRWMLDFEEKWNYPLLNSWQKGMIQALWEWRCALPEMQAGIQAQIPMFASAARLEA